MANILQDLTLSESQKRILLRQIALENGQSVPTSARTAGAIYENVSKKMLRMPRAAGGQGTFPWSGRAMGSVSAVGDLLGPAAADVPGQMTFNRDYLRAQARRNINDLFFSEASAMAEPTTEWKGLIDARSAARAPTAARPVAGGLFEDIEGQRAARKAAYDARYGKWAGAASRLNEEERTALRAARKARLVAGKGGKRALWKGLGKTKRLAGGLLSGPIGWGLDAYMLGSLLHESSGATAEDLQRRREMGAFMKQSFLEEGPRPEEYRREQANFDMAYEGTRLGEAMAMGIQRKINDELAPLIAGQEALLDSAAVRNQPSAAEMLAMRGLG
jgi:hypothetical protein